VGPLSSTVDFLEASQKLKSRQVNYLQPFAFLSSRRSLLNGKYETRHTVGRSCPVTNASGEYPLINGGVCSRAVAHTLSNSFTVRANGFLDARVIDRMSGE